MRRPSKKPTTIDAYLAGVSSDKRAALQRLRKTIKAAAPRAEETISYQMPGFRLDGRMLVWFAAAANHCSFFPGGVVAEYKDELKGYGTSKGTIRFQPDKPIPAALVRKIVKARVAENAANIPARRGPATTRRAVRRASGRK